MGQTGVGTTILQGGIRPLSYDRWTIDPSVIVAGREPAA
jgi:hypothetical protein